MKQVLATLLGVALVFGPVAGLAPGGGVAVAQVVVVPSFPASAIIRGENIRLRAEPADRAEDLAALQRGDEITITGEPERADGMVFYPIEVVVTGDSGWVRDLFINPKSIVPLLGTAPVPAPAAEPAPEPETAAEPSAEENGNRNNRQERRQQRQREREAAEEPAAEAPVDEPAPEAQPEAEQPADDAPRPTPEPEATEPEPAPEEEAPAEEEPAADIAASVAGEDVMATEPFTLQPGRYRVTATLEASDATGFVVNLLGPRNFNEPLFEDQIDTAESWTVRTSVTVEREGDYVVEVVEAAGTWVIEFEAR